MRKNLLLYRMIVLNVLFIVGLAAAWQKGWGPAVWYSDETMVTRGIVALFLVGWGSTWINALRIQREGRSIAKPLINVRLQSIEHLKSIADWLTYIGFFGTVVGFAVALDAASSGMGDASTITGMMSGMKVSLATTLVGCVFGLWTEVNYLMLKTATICKAEG